MTEAEARARSAWAERILAVLLLPFAFVVMVGGGAGLIWLWHDFRPQFWIGVSGLTVFGLLGSSANGSLRRSRLRSHWAAGHDGVTQEQALTELSLDEDFRTRAERRRAAAQVDPLSTADPAEVMAEVLAGIEAMQQHLSVLVSQVSTEQRVTSGRHAGPVMVDIRDQVTDPNGHLDDDLSAADDDLDGRYGDEIDDAVDDIMRGTADSSPPPEPPAAVPPAAGPPAVAPPAVAPHEPAAHRRPAREVPAHGRPAADLPAADLPAREPSAYEALSFERDAGPAATAAPAVSGPSAEPEPAREPAQESEPAATRWDIPAPRSRVQVIHLPRDGAPGDEQFEDEDEDYFGEDDLDIGPVPSPSGEADTSTEQAIGDHRGTDGPLGDGSFRADDAGNHRAGDQFTGERTRRPRDAR